MHGGPNVLFDCDVDYRRKRGWFRRVFQQMKTPTAREQLVQGEKPGQGWNCDRNHLPIE